MQTRAKTNLPIFKMQRDPPEIYTIRVSPYIGVLPTNLPLPHPKLFWNQWALSIQPKIPEISLGTSSGTDHFGWSDRNIRDQF